MSAQAKAMNGMDGVAEVPAAAVPVTGNWAREFVWSVRRELWEHRAIFFAPLAAAGLLIVGFAIGEVRRRGVFADPDQSSRMIALQLVSAPYVLAFVASLVAVFFCLDALFGERRDRSISFWKSLPVSDLTVVLSKMTIPVVVIPAVCFVLALATQAAMILLCVLLAWGRMIPALPWGDLPLAQATEMLLFQMFAVLGLWFVPIYAWLLLASAWAKRAPLLWAILPPAGVVLGERFALHTRYFAEMLKDRFQGGEFGFGIAIKHCALSGAMLGRFAVSPELWGGLFLGGLFLAGAVRLRRLRGPI